MLKLHRALQTTIRILDFIMVRKKKVIRKLCTEKWPILMAQDYFGCCFKNNLQGVEQKQVNYLGSLGRAYTFLPTIHSLFPHFSWAQGSSQKGLHFPPPHAAKCGCVTKCWLMECEQRDRRNFGAMFLKEEACPPLPSSPLSTGGNLMGRTVPAGPAILGPKMEVTWWRWQSLKPWEASVPDSVERLYQPGYLCTGSHWRKKQSSTLYKTPRFRDSETAAYLYWNPFRNDCNCLAKYWWWLWWG